jgi:hypothetical protein
MERIAMRGTGRSILLYIDFYKEGHHVLYRRHITLLCIIQPVRLAKIKPAIQSGKRKENLMKIVRLFVAVCKDPEMARFETKKPLCHRPIWIASDGHARFVVRQFMEKRVRYAMVLMAASRRLDIAASKYYPLVHCRSRDFLDGV